MPWTSQMNILDTDTIDLVLISWISSYHFLPPINNCFILMLWTSIWKIKQFWQVIGLSHEKWNSALVGIRVVNLTHSKSRNWRTRYNWMLPSPHIVVYCVDQNMQVVACGRGKLSSLITVHTPGQPPFLTLNAPSRLWTTLLACTERIIVWYSAWTSCSAAEQCGSQSQDWSRFST